MRDPFPVVAMLGAELEKQRTGWRDVKALVLLVGLHSDSWTPAAMLADALGVDPGLQEALYNEVQQHRARGTHGVTEPLPDTVFAPIDVRDPQHA